MKRNILKKYNRLISILLSLLGIGGSFNFTSCDGTGQVEYGTPSATFKIYGKVTSEEGEQIPYIKVKSALHYDSSYTNENGDYTLVLNSFPSDQDFYMEYSDVDGALYGSYQTKDTIVEFNDPQFENGDGSWYSGEASKKVDIQLEEDN
jgi:putative lipoprotein (rSAM/lipoprotein system)